MSRIKSRGKIVALGATLAVALLALAPGAWAPAIAQTAGTPTATPTSTTTTSPDGTVTTVTTEPDGTTTTVVEVPNQGTVTIVQAPNQPVEVTVAPANPNSDTTMQLDVLGAQLSVPAGTLSTDEVISIVEQSFNLVIVLGSIDEANAANEGGSAIQSLTQAGDITPVRVLEMTVQKPDGTTGQIQKPILWTWDFTAEEFAAAGGNYDNLLMLNYDEATGTWSPVEQVGHTATSVTFEIPHFSLWALAISQASPTAPPSPADTGMGLTEESGGTNPLAIALGVLALAGVLGTGARFAMGRRSA